MYELHKGFYDYSLIKVYKSSEERVPILCPIHGVFNQSFYNHAKKCGCKKCTIDKYVAKYYESHKNNFFKQFNEKFENKLDLIGEYINNSTSIEYKCKSCKLTYKNTPNKLLAKGNKGCAYCYGNGKHKQTLAYFEKYKDLLVEEIGFLYIVRLYNEQENFIKIGITKQESCETRFEKIPYKKEILFIQENSMYNCFKIEQISLKENKFCNYKPKNWFGGGTECFSLECYSAIENLIKLYMAESLNQI